MKVELIKWTQELKPELIKICNNVDRTYLSDRMPYPYTDAAADWWLGMVSEHDGKDGVFRAIVADGTIVGNISIEQKQDVYCRDGEIGYLLLTEHWSKGIMTDAVRQICEAAFSELDIIRITGLVYAPNTASQRVLEKNGFVREGLQKNAVYKNGKILDLCLFGKTAQTDYQDINAKTIDPCRMNGSEI
ncbi:MAG: GNAT family N-acetyltransferase [Mogibacterium sp.]|nr:GNAT family N-acetyltransferase [Mogibacterium sp.]